MVTKGQTDITLVFIIFFLVVFGIIMIYSSSYYASYEQQGTHIHFLLKQSAWAVLGFIVMYVVSYVSFDVIYFFSPWLYAASLVFLGLVLAIGEKVKGQKRWLKFGVIQFQPSEFAKFALIILLAYLVSRMLKHITRLKVLVLIILIIALPAALIGIANMSTSLVLMSIGGAVLLVTYPKIAKFLMVTIPVGIIAIVLLVTFAGYRMGRVKIFLEGPWSDPQGLGYQTIQSLYAIGSGGLFGTGLGQSMQKNGFIPEAHNDMIFSIVCEEIGLFGALALILLFIMLIWRCIVIASNSTSIDRFLIVVGVMAQIAVQVIINIAVVTNSIPTTGMPLPFISYGGSSLIFLMAEMGLVLNVARDSKMNKI
jgi:cell division protein FtsW